MAITDIIVIILLSVLIAMFGWQMYCKNGVTSVSQPVYVQQSSPQRVAYQQSARQTILKKKKKVPKRVEFEEEARSLRAMDDTLSDIGSIAGKEYQ